MPASNLASVARKPPTNGWKPGQSGNPHGRPRAPVDIAALAREHGPRCIQVAVDLLKDPDSRIRLGALNAVLDRGFGRPNQNVTATGDGTLTLHLLAAQASGRDLLNNAPGHEHRTIDGEAEGTTLDIASAPLPLE